MMQSGGFSPASLFADGVIGVWYDPSDLTTLFQDSAGTTPVTASGQPVGKMLDKSGNGNHATQAISAKRPIYTEGSGLSWLAFDGVDDFMSVPSSTDKFKFLHNGLGCTTFSAIDSASGHNGVIYMTSLDTSDVGATLYIDSNRYRSAVINATGTTIALGNTLGIATGVDILTVLNSSGKNPNYQLFEKQASSFTTNYVGSPSTSNATNNFSIGSRNGESLFFSGKMFGLISLGADATSEQIASTEAYLAAKSGVTL